jgi:thioesterase domain-containing protein
MTALLKAAEVEHYLHRHIPISAMMGVRVAACDATGVVLHAPLAPNINHRATVFGGSASAVAILAAWTQLHFTLRQAGIAERIVIQRNQIEYLAPIAADFEAVCPALPAEALARLLKTFHRLGRARTAMSVELRCAGQVVARFHGDYVAVRLRAGEKV